MKKLFESLQKLEKDHVLSGWGEKIAKAILVVVVAVSLLILAQIGMFFGIFNWLEGVVRTTTGLDAMLSKAIAFLLLALLFGTPLGGFIWSLPIPQKNKKRKRFILLSVFGLVFVVAYFASRNVYFDVQTGEPLKYYSIDASGGYRFFSSEGYDPVTGEELRPVDGRIIRALYAGGSVLVQKSINSDGVEVYNLSGYDIDGSSASMYEGRYLVKFRNEKERGIFLCYTEGHDASGGTTVILIPARKAVSLWLSEGSHQIAFVDTEFNEYGFRKGGSVLVRSYSSEGLYLAVDGNKRIFNDCFSLQVLSQKKQVVTLKNSGLITHSKEKSGEEKDVIKYSYVLFFGSVSLISGLAILNSKTKKNSFFDADMGITFFFGGLVGVIYGLVNLIGLL